MQQNLLKMDDHRNHRLLFRFTLQYLVFGLMFGGFEVAFVLRFRNSIIDIILMQMAAFCMVFVGFLAASHWLRQGRARSLFRFGFALQAVTCMYLALMVPHVHDLVYLLPFFLLRGMADGVFSGGRSVVFLALVDDRNRDQWALKFQIFSVGMGLTLPVLAGVIISFFNAGKTTASVLPPGYSILLFSIGVWAIVCFATSPSLKIAPQVISLRGWRPLLRGKNQRAWVVLVLVGCFSGVVNSLANAALNVQILGNELRIGAFSAWISLLGAVFFWQIRVQTKKTPLKRLPWIFVGTAGEVVSRTIYIIWTNAAGLFAKSLVDSFAVPFRGLLGENIVRKRLEIAAAANKLSLAQVMYVQEFLILSMRLATGFFTAVLFSIIKGNITEVSRILLIGCIPFGILEFFLLRAIDRINRQENV